MITLIATLKVKEGKMDEVKEKLRKIVAQVKNSEPGCLEYIPHTVKGEVNTVIFYEKYLDKDALKIHSANFMENFKDLMPLLEPGMDLKTCFEIIE
ncbi:MAG TPA: putative quinol monooxygenase [Spirochaetota bacterium]|nr:putative quinol monooxygenase [Spirochaetota bacterium]HPS86239.1 putative quinol monooxygenase [Spirochaetota bacterium]